MGNLILVLITLGLLAVVTESFPHNNHDHRNFGNTNTGLNNPHGEDMINGTYPPYDIDRVNDGVRTILRGVSDFRLSEILRGSFKFTRNDNVRNVANNVIDSIFGPPTKPPPNASGEEVAPLRGL